MLCYTVQLYYYRQTDRSSHHHKVRMICENSSNTQTTLSCVGWGESTPEKRNIERKLPQLYMFFVYANGSHLFFHPLKSCERRLTPLLLKTHDRTVQYSTCKYRRIWKCRLECPYATCPRHACAPVRRAFSGPRRSIFNIIASAFDAFISSSAVSQVNWCMGRGRP